MINNKTPFLEQPTFENAFAVGKKTGGVYITLNNGEYVKCECLKTDTKATIAFDLYTCSCKHNLSSETQQSLYNQHKAYGYSELPNAGYDGVIQCSFSDTVLYFDVLLKDAEIWLQKILSTLNSNENLVEATLQIAATGMNNNVVGAQSSAMN